MKKTALLLPAILMLHACGGGGGSSPSPTPPAPPPPPPVVASPAFTIPATVTKSADAGIGSNPLVMVDVKGNVELTDTQKGGYSFTKNGLDQVYFSPRDNLVWETIFYFKDPSEIGPGVYTDTVRVGLCVDVDCAALIAGTTSTVTVTYTVTGTVPPPPAVQGATNSVSATATAYSADQPRITVPLTYLHERANRSFSATTSSAYLGALNSQVTNATATGADLEITFRPASMLAPGVYDDVITVDVCSSCPTPVQGSPLIIQARYTVTDTVDGPDGYQVRLLPHAANELAWDASSQRIYMTIPASASSNASSIIAVDPQDGAVNASVSAGMNPTELSLAADGSFAYVASLTSNEVRRFTLPALAADTIVSLGSGDAGLLAAGDIQVSPFDADLLSVERVLAIGDGNPFDLALIDNGMVRPDVAPGIALGQQFRGLSWAGPALIYSHTDVIGADGAIARLDITAGEISAHTTTVLNGASGLPHLGTQWDGAFLYRANGEKVDVVAGSIVGVYPEVSPGGLLRTVVADAANNRLFALAGIFDRLWLVSYTLDTQQHIASVPLLGVPFEGNVPLKLIRYGTDGLATATSDGRVVLVEGAFVAP